MSQHTPGPWITGPQHVVRREYRDNAGVRVIQFIAEVCVPAGRSPEDVSATAQLIAAAPDMLDALTVIDAYLYTTAPNSNEHQIVQRAIATARGETA